MKFLNFLIIIFISLTSSIKADLDDNLINQLEKGGKLIFIRHAYACLLYTSPSPRDRG